MVKPPNKWIFITKSAEKTDFALEFESDSQYFWSFRPPTAPLWHHACFFLVQTLLGGRNFFLAQAVIWGARPQNGPPWRRACTSVIEN